MRCTVVREGDALYVRYETVADSSPERVVGWWPVSQDRSIGAFKLVGCVVEDPGYGGVFSASPGHVGQDYWSLTNFRAVLMNGGKTEAARVERTPIPPPKVRAGVEVRWYRGRWQKLLKRGWVDAGVNS